MERLLKLMNIVAPDIQVVPVRTPTLPPATHTNCYIVGKGSLSIFDPASPWEDEQQHLNAQLQTRFEKNEKVERIVLTHHHADHVSGALALQSHLRTLGQDVPILAHPKTAELLGETLPVDEDWNDAQEIDCGGRTLKALFTPGHAPGHLIFLDPQSRAVIAGDMVAGLGTIILEPHEADLGQYLDSLSMMRTLKASVLLPAHGPPLSHPDTILSFYIAHRHQRSNQMREVLQTLGQSSPYNIARVVYPELPENILPLAAAQTLTHLRWLQEHGMATSLDEESLWASL
jgi:ribonuclease/clavin/mitogillin